jgi:chromosome partitioning protein
VAAARAAHGWSTPEYEHTMAVSIACVSGKGGVGKTTTCASLAGVFAERERRILAVDMDPQSNLTSGLGFNPYTLSHTVAEVIVDPEHPVDELILRTRWPNLHLLPASPDLSAVEAALPTAIDRELRLRTALTRDVRDYDFIIYDTPPSFGFHTVSVLAATDFIIVPVQMSGYAIKGLKETLRTVHEARERLNPRLRVLGLVATFVTPRTRFSRDMMEGLRAIPNLRVFETPLKTTVRLQECALAGEPITAYAGSSDAAKAYRAFADEVLEAVIAEAERGV